MENSRLASLLAIINLPGYRVLCDYFEQEIRKIEREVFDITPEEGDKVLAAHRVALGARWAYERTIKRIEQDISGLLKEEKPPLTQQEEDDLHIKGLSMQ